MLARVVDLGRMAYAPAAHLQATLLERVADGRSPHTLLLVEHPPVITLGAGFHPENLLLPVEEYRRRGFEVAPTSRGGDVTYHGPGQLVAYPIFRIDDFGRDLHKWMRSLEETVLAALRTWDLEGYRFPPHTGVWIAEKKVAAIGIKVRKWVSMHGIALNCADELSPFELIVPCGIRGYGVTSIGAQLGRPVELDEVKPRLAEAFEATFGVNLDPVPGDALHEELGIARALRPVL